MVRAAEVVTYGPRGPRLTRRASFVLLAVVSCVAVAVAVAVVAIATRDDPVASPSASASPSANPLTLGNRKGVSTDRDHDRFTYAFTVQNATNADVSVTGIELVPSDGLTVVLASVVTLAEFQQVWDPMFVPSARDGRERLQPGSEMGLLVRVAVDCAAPPVVQAVRVHVRQGDTLTQQDIPAMATNNSQANLDLRTLPSRSCA